MKNKLNLYKNNKIENLLKLGRTSKKDLINISKSLNINNLQVKWAEEYDIEKDKNIPTILNIGDNHEGSHWVAVYKGNYFDSFGMAPDSDIPGYKQLKYNEIQIQDINKEFCGSYCLLWLYYAINNDIKTFYNLF